MAAGINDRFNKVLSGTTRPVATTLSAQKLVGATSATVQATTGWDTATAVHGIMYRVNASNQKIAGSQIDWKATISGTTLANFTVTAGTDDTYEVGTVVELAPTAAWGDDMATGILVSHDQDGTLKAGAVDNVNVLANDVVETAKIKDSNVTEAKLTHRPSEYIFDHIASGCVWSGDAYGSTRVASMTSGVAYINGIRVPISAVTSRTFTASKDTYIDVDNTGTITYTEVSNNAASPALASNSIRLGIIITGASNIANVGSVNQGQEDKVLPIASSIAYSVTDSLGNLICPRDPQRRILGQRQKTADSTATTIAQVTGLSSVINIPTARKVEITLSAESIYNSSSTQVVTAKLWDGVVSSGTLLKSAKAATAATNQQFPLTVSTIKTLSAGVHTINASIESTSGTVTMTAGATSPAELIIKLV